MTSFVMIIFGYNKYEFFDSKKTQQNTLAVAQTEKE